MTVAENLPVAIIGAGPVGLAAAAHLVARKIPVKLYESGPNVGHNVSQWQHVRLFSPWRYNVDTASASLLKQCGWQEPHADILPTGEDLNAAYLHPLAETPPIQQALETKAIVRSVARRGIDKVVSSERARHPFALAVERHGSIRIDLARAVIDASGTWQNQNPMGVSGTPAMGEAAHADRIVYGIPDLLGADRSNYANKRVLVIGGGHSAANALLDFARLANSGHALRVTWAVRRDNLERIFGGGLADQLPARGKLGSDLRQLVESGCLQLVTRFAAEEVVDSAAGLIVKGRTPSGAASVGPVDRIIVATGQRPDLNMTRELRLDLDPWLECPRRLGPSIDPNLHSCGTVPPHGHKELSHPEPDFFTVGIKSYGRAPTFLMATGYEQVRSIAARLAGDHAAADQVQLVLPETGVCSTDLLQVDEGCCGSPQPKAGDPCCPGGEATQASQISGCCGPASGASSKCC